MVARRIVMPYLIIIILGIVCIGLLIIVSSDQTGIIEIPDLLKEIQKSEPTCGEGTEEIGGICYPKFSRSV